MWKCCFWGAKGLSRNTLVEDRDKFRSSAVDPTLGCFDRATCRGIEADSTEVIRAIWIEA